MELLIYGLAPHEDRQYMETLLSTQCKTLEDVELIKKKASLAGFHSFRVAFYNGEKPNFVATINKRRV